MDEAALQEKYMEYQVMEQQMNLLQNQLEKFKEQKENTVGIISSLEELKSCNKGDEFLAPIAGGIFIKAKIEDAQELIVNVGSGVVTTKNVDDAKRLLNEQITEIDEALITVQAQYQDVVLKMEGLQDSLNNMVK